jgi:hypothetical protein
VVTVCDNAAEKCPIFPFAYKYLHWSIPDPAAEPDGPRKLDAFRTARDLLRDRIERELVPLLPGYRQHIGGEGATKVPWPDSPAAPGRCGDPSRLRQSACLPGGRPSKDFIGWGWLPSCPPQR